MSTRLYIPTPPQGPNFHLIPFRHIHVDTHTHTNTHLHTRLRSRYFYSSSQRTATWFSSCQRTAHPNYPTYHYTLSHTYVHAYRKAGIWPCCQQAHYLASGQIVHTSRLHANWIICVCGLHAWLQCVVALPCLAVVLTVHQLLCSCSRSHSRKIYHTSSQTMSL
jgi:hypothetical protein